MKVNPFRDFLWDQWVLFAVTTAVGVVLAFAGTSKIGIGLSVAIALTISLLGYFVALWGGKLTSITQKIDLQLRTADADTQQIADHLEYLIDLTKQKEKKKAVKKGLNGIRQSLTYKGIEEKDLRRKVLEALNEEWKQFVSVSIFGPAEWMDPHWFSYLTLQVARAAELKPNGIIAKRYFIYEKKTAEEYREELKLIVEAHGNYVKPFLYYRKDVEDNLKKAKVELVDFAFIEYENNRELVLWRNPKEEGEVEIINDASRIKPFKGIIACLNSLESLYDRKGGL